jgi:hypothetical protein
MHLAVLGELEVAADTQAGRRPGQLPVTKGLFSVDSEVPTKRIARRAQEEPRMERYDALSEPDAYVASRDAFECLVSTLAGVSAAGMAHDELEGRSNSKDTSCCGS